MISAYQSATESRFVWRGAADADWPLFSSLVRAYVTKHGSVPMEPALRQFEEQVLDEAREWGLDWHLAGGRLTALELLAALQHYSVPTRLLDFTFQPPGRLLVRGGGGGYSARARLRYRHLRAADLAGESRRSGPMVERHRTWHNDRVGDSVMGVAAAPVGAAHSATGRLFPHGRCPVNEPRTQSKDTQRLDAAPSR